MRRFMLTIMTLLFIWSAVSDLYEAGQNLTAYVQGQNPSNVAFMLYNISKAILLVIGIIPIWLIEILYTIEAYFEEESEHLEQS